MSVHTKNKEITVWLIEDDLRYRDTVAYLIDHTSDMSCGRAFDACEEALEMLDTYAGRARSWSFPDVLLLDVRLPGLSGIEGIGQLKAQLPRTSIVMLTVRKDAGTIYKALRAGASGYLFKDSGVDEIIAAIREANRGGMLMPAPVARKVRAFFQEQEPVPNYGLTPREQEVLFEMTLGRSQKEVAGQLGIARHTVDTHVRSIYDKLHVHSATEAVAKAIRERLVEERREDVA